MAINLLPQLRAEDLKRLRRKKTFELLSIGVLVITLIVVVGVFAFWAVLGNEAAAVSNKIEETESAVNTFSGVESLFRGLELKLNFLGQILPARLPYSQLLEDTEELLPEGVRISEFLLDETGQILLSGIAFSYVDLGNSLEAFSAARIIAGQPIKKVTVSSIVREKGGNYKFSLKLTLEKPTGLGED